MLVLLDVPSLALPSCVCVYCKIHADYFASCCNNSYNNRGIFVVACTGDYSVVWKHNGRPIMAGAVLIKLNYTVSLADAQTSSILIKGVDTAYAGENSTKCTSDRPCKCLLFSPTNCTQVGDPLMASPQKSRPKEEKRRTACPEIGW